MRYWIPEDPSLVLRRVAHESALEIVWLELRALILLQMHIGKATENAQVRHVRFGAKERFEGCLLDKSGGGHAIVSVDSSIERISPE